MQGIQSLRNKRRIKHTEVLNGEPDRTIVLSSGVDIHTPATEYAGVLVNDVIHHRIHLNPSPSFSTIPVVLDVVVNLFILVHYHTSSITLYLNIIVVSGNSSNVNYATNRECGRVH